jgi:hypothetical protein
MSKMKLIVITFALNLKLIVVKTYFLHQLVALNQSHLSFCLLYFLSFINQAFCIQIFFSYLEVLVIEKIRGFLSMFVGSSVQVEALGVRGARLLSCLGSSNASGFF